MTGCLIPFAVAVAFLVTSTPASPAVDVSAAPLELSTELGRTVTFSTTVTADDSASVEPLIAHLNIASLRPGVYVDPEDWSGERTRYMRPLPAGGSTTLRWKIKAVNSGRFAAYVSIVRPTGSTPPRVSPVVTIDVAGRRTLNPNGIGPLAIGVPVVLLASAAALRLRRLRR